MKTYELIQEIEKRGISVELCQDGRLKVAPISAARDLLEEMASHRDEVVRYVKGLYVMTIEGLLSELRERPRHWWRIEDRYSPECLEGAKRTMRIAEQINGFYRLTSEAEVSKFERHREGRAA